MKIEPVAAVVFLLVIIAMLAGVNIPPQVLILLGGGLAVMILVVPVTVFTNEPINKLSFKRNKHAEFYKGLRIAAFGLACLLVGIMFRLMIWPGGESIIILGIILCIGAVGMAVKYNGAGKRIFFKNLVLRTSVAALLGIILLLLSPAQVVDLRFKNHPEYRDALKYSLAHPASDSARKVVYEEWKKLKDN